MKIKIALLTATIIAFSVPWAGYAQSSESLSIDTNGNVGVGTTMPTAPLEIVNDGGEQPLFRIDASGYNLSVTDDVKLTRTFVNGTLRNRVRANGQEAWFIRNKNGEIGKIGYSTPRGHPGILIFTGSPGAYTDRWQIVNNASGYTELYYDADGPGSSLVIEQGGQVGIGTTSPSAKLDVNGTIEATNIQQTSSQRWKTNVHPLADALSLLDQLEGVRYEWKKTGEADVGFIAEEVGQVLPEIVAYETNGVDAKSVNYSKITAVLVEAVKEQQAQIRKQQNQIRSLQQVVTRLENRAATDPPEK